MLWLTTSPPPAGRLLVVLKRDSPPGTGELVERVPVEDFLLRIHNRAVVCVETDDVDVVLPVDELDVVAVLRQRCRR